MFAQFYYRNDREKKRDTYWNVWSSTENLSINLKPSVWYITATATETVMEKSSFSN